MKALIIIPARGGSKGIKNKNIKLLCGKPLIGYTIEAAKKSKLADRIVVSTDDEKIAAVAKDYGIAVIKRPAEYSTDSAPIELALRHAVKYLKKDEDYSPDIVVWLQANVPIRKSGQIDSVINKLIESKADSAITVTEVTQRPEYVMQMKDDGRLVKLSKNIPQLRTDKYRRQEFGDGGLYIADGAVLAMKTSALMDSEGRGGAHVYLGEDVRGVVEEPRYALEVDEPFDFEIVEGLLKKRKNRSA
jgi:CMP-N-acetylneuraminic acid synthetase